jgi:hypothetical protein
LISLNTKPIHVFFISTSRDIPQLSSIDIFSMTMWTFQMGCLIWIHNKQGAPLTDQSRELLMAEGWSILILRTFQYHSHHLLDGTGVPLIKPNPLQLKKPNCVLLRPMNPFMRFILLLDSSLPSFALKSDLLTLSRRRPMHGIQYKVWRLQFIRMHASTAWLTMCIGCSISPNGPDLPQLLPEDLHVTTLVLGSDKAGQCNKQQSWIWSFGQTTEDDGMWMDDCQ